MHPFIAITGGAGGIAQAVAKRLVGDGARVILLDRDAQAVAQAAQALGCDSAALDVADRDAITAMAQHIESEYGPLTGYVAAAGCFENPHSPAQTDPALWQQVMDVNLSGTLWTATAFGKAMVERGYGSIVTLGSVVGMGSSPLLAYGTSKAAISSLSKSLAVAWGRSGVRVNCVAPGPTLTPSLQASYDRGERDPVARLKFTALGRMCMPDEVANVIAFLLSDQASAVTGIEMPVDCGIMAAGLWSLYNGVPEPALP